MTSSSNRSWWMVGAAMVALVACSDDSDGGGAAAGGASGSGGSGQAGAAGAAGGSAGAAGGEAGSAGAAGGNAGSAGAAGGSAGSAGATGGSAGSAGAAGGSAGSAGATGGSAGSAGSAGATGGSAGSAGAAGATGGSAGAAGSGGQVDGNIVGVAGVAAFDGMSTQQKDALKKTKVFFLHQSVGANLVDGAESLGFAFRWADSASDYNTTYLGEKTTEASNHFPLLKLDELAGIHNGIGKVVKVAGLKFCYTDIEETTSLSKLQAEYKKVMDGLRQQQPQLKLFHVTVPFNIVGEWNGPKTNAMRKSFADWQKATFASTDVIFDLQEVESTKADGSRCYDGGVPALCSDWYDGQDGSHLNPVGSERAARAFLYSLHLAATK